MQKSETIGKLAEALSKAQGVMEGAKKDSSNPYFKSKYSDLSSVWDACRKPLSENGLSVSQVTNSTPEGHPVITTILMHSSGEWISGELMMNPSKVDPQAVGSAITYGRRYALAAIVGIAPEDDDAEGATDHTTHTKPPVTAPKPKTEAKEPAETSEVWDVDRICGVLVAANTKDALHNLWKSLMPRMSKLTGEEKLACQLVKDNRGKSLEV